MSNKQEYSRQQWELEMWERQHNFTPAQVTRHSRFRESGQPMDSPLPITIRVSRFWTGIALLLLSATAAVLYPTGWLVLPYFAGGGAGCYLIITAVRWIGK